MSEHIISLLNFGTAIISLLVVIFTFILQLKDKKTTIPTKTLRYSHVDKRNYNSNNRVNYHQHTSNTIIVNKPSINSTSAKSSEYTTDEAVGFIFVVLILCVLYNNYNLYFIFCMSLYSALLCIVGYSIYKKRCDEYIYTFNLKIFNLVIFSSLIIVLISQFNWFAPPILDGTSSQITVNDLLFQNSQNASLILYIMFKLFGFIIGGLLLLSQSINVFKMTFHKSITENNYGLIITLLICQFLLSTGLLYKLIILAFYN